MWGVEERGAFVGVDVEASEGGSRGKRMCGVWPAGQYREGTSVVGIPTVAEGVKVCV